MNYPLHLQNKKNMYVYVLKIAINPFTYIKNYF